MMYVVCHAQRKIQKTESENHCGSTVKARSDEICVNTQGSIMDIVGMHTIKG